MTCVLTYCRPAKRTHFLSLSNPQYIKHPYLQTIIIIFNPREETESERTYTRNIEFTGKFIIDISHVLCQRIGEIKRILTDKVFHMTNILEVINKCRRI